MVFLVFLVTASPTLPARISKFCLPILEVNEMILKQYCQQKSLCLSAGCLLSKINGCELCLVFVLTGYKQFARINMFLRFFRCSLIQAKRERARNAGCLLLRNSERTIIQLCKQAALYIVSVYHMLLECKIPEFQSLNRSYISSISGAQFNV